MKIRFMKRLTGADEVNFTAGNGGMCLIVNTSNEMYILPQTLYVTSLTSDGRAHRVTNT